MNYLCFHHNGLFPSVSEDVSAPALTAMLGCFHRYSTYGNKPNDRNLDHFLCYLLTHFSLQNVPLRTQCDCIFPLNMVTSLTVWVQITFHISYSHWLILFWCYDKKGESLKFIQFHYVFVPISTSVKVQLFPVCMVWGSMYVRTHTDPLSRFLVGMLCFLSKYESHGNWLKSVPVSFSSQKW